MDDSEILQGLVDEPKRRPIFENALYAKYVHLINEGINNHRLSYEDSFSAYSDAVLTVIHNVQDKTFAQRSAIGTYLYRIHSNKCIDLFRKRTSQQGRVNESQVTPELLFQLPDKVKSVIENIIDDQKIEVLRKKMDELGDKCKKILVLFQDNYSDQQIAELIGISSASVVKVTRLRCLQKIKEKMKSFIKTK